MRNLVIGILAGVVLTGMVSGLGLRAATAQTSAAPVARILCTSESGEPCPIFSPWRTLADNRQVLFMATGSTLDTAGVYLQDLAGGSARRVGPFIREPFTYGIVSVGNRVALMGVLLGSGAVTPELWLFDSSQSNPSVRQIPLVDGGELIGLSPSGEWLYYRAIGSGAQQLWRVAMSGSGDPQQLTYPVPTGTSLQRASFDPSGHIVLRFSYGSPSGNGDWPTVIGYDLDQTPQFLDLGTVYSVEFAASAAGMPYAVYADATWVLYSLPLTTPAGSPIRLSRTDRRTTQFRVAKGQVLFASLPVVEFFPFVEYWSSITGPATGAVTITQIATGTYPASMTTSFSGPLGARILRRDPTCGSDCAPGQVYTPTDLAAGPINLPTTWRDLMTDPLERHYLVRVGSDLVSVPIDAPLSTPVALNDVGTPFLSFGGDLRAFDPTGEWLVYSSGGATFFRIPGAGPLAARAEVGGDTRFRYNLMGNTMFTRDGRYLVHAAAPPVGVSASPLVVIDLEPPPPATATPTPTLTPTVTATPAATATPQPTNVRVYLPDVRKVR